MTDPMLSASTAVQKWADPAMFASEKLDATAGPRVHLLAAPADPLGQIAAMALMYKGIVVRDLADITDEQRLGMFAQITQTRLKAPFEAVTFHWMVEGVTRSLTHQMVRQRTAVFAQESLRFAVVEDDFEERVALPPSLTGTAAEFLTLEREYTQRFAQAGIDRNFNDLDAAGEWYEVQVDRLPQEERWRMRWELALRAVGDAYGRNVADGMPAEDARGLLPHNITTRLNYVTNLRNFQEHAGNRLCTQAQFEWRSLWVAFVQELRAYGSRVDYTVGNDVRNSEWQYDLIADLFRPACYLTGKCEFAAQDLDRKCRIRSRVDAFALHGVPSSEWGNTVIAPVAVNTEGPLGGEVELAPIYAEEWLADPGAAR